MRRLPCQFKFAILVVPLLAGCQEETIPSSQSRPVSFVTLEETDPSATMRLAGTAESWKREEIAFEVAGRVTQIVEPGANIIGRTYDEQGEPLTDGSVLAELDDERYRIAKEQAEAGAEACRTELEQVIPQQLREAQANLELQEKELARNLSMQAQDAGAVAQATIDRFDAAVKGATAQVAQVEALRATKAAELNSFQSQIEQAERNMRDCTLVSPFSGQIARVHVIPGGYAFRGLPVLTVQMMDPIKVNIAVSPQTDKRINFNDVVSVYTPSGEQLDGFVYLKDTFADPTTRTFLITLLVRNRRIEEGLPEEFRDKAIPRCTNFWNLQRPEGATSGNYYLDVGAINKDDEGHFVWKADGLTLDQLKTDFSPVVKAKKVRVTPGDARIAALQIYTFREIADLGDIDPEQDVIIGGVSGDLEDGGQVALVRQRWALRPGDLVRVGLRGQEKPTGLYVPEEAVQFKDSTPYVAVADETADGEEVTFVNVKIGEPVGQLRRIEPADEGALTDGMKVIVGGAHYVAEGDSVRAIDELNVSP